MKKVALAFALFAATATPALAQTAGTTPTFTGAHVDVTAGWNRGTTKDVLPGPGDQRSRKSDVAVRGSAGYDVALGDSAIVGAEIGIGSGGRDIQTIRGNNLFTVDPRLTVDAAARFGVKPSDGLLVYGKAGRAMQRVTASLAQTGGAAVTGRDTEHGFLWGGGAQVALSRNVSLKAEYDRVKFNDYYKRSRLMGGLSFNF